jgi:hypothetical protein
MPISHLFASQKHHRRRHCEGAAASRKYPMDSIVIDSVRRKPI